MNFWTRDGEKEGDLDLEAVTLTIDWIWVGSGWEKEGHTWRSKEYEVEVGGKRSLFLDTVTLGDCGTLVATGVYLVREQRFPLLSWGRRWLYRSVKNLLGVRLSLDWKSIAKTYLLFLMQAEKNPQKNKPLQHCD